MCAAIPVIKVLRESLVVTNVHRVLGIVNGTTNFVLTEMEAGTSYDEALAEAQARGYAEADPTDDVSGADAAAKMAILATVAFNSRVDARRRRLLRHHDDRSARRRGGARARHGDPARRRRAGSSTGRSTCASSRRSSTSSIRWPKVDGAFNAVMLQGDAIREITLEGPGAGGIETASAVDRRHHERDRDDGHRVPAERRRLARRCPSCRPATAARRSTSACVKDRPGALARVAEELAEREISIARLVQHANGNGAALHVVTHEARAGALEDALAALGELPEVHGRSCRCRSSPTAASRSSDGRDRRRAVARRGLDAARPRARALSEALGCELHLKCEGVEPDGELQGPRHGRRGRARGGARRARGRLRVDRQHGGVARPRTRRARASRRSC